MIWATGFVAARFVSPHAEAFTFVAIRVVLVALVLGALALARGARWPRDRARLVPRRARRSADAGDLRDRRVLVGATRIAGRYRAPWSVACSRLLTATLAGPVLGEP